MKSCSVTQLALPGTSRLFGDYLYRFEQVSAFYVHDFHYPAMAAAQVAYPNERRTSMADILCAQNGNSETLALFTTPGTVAVVTGQQVGFLGGPVYALYKALTAISLAAQLSAQGIPAVPIFWLATEDHDWAEIDHAWLFDQNCTPRRISLGSSPMPGGPVGTMAVETIDLEGIRAGLGDLPFADGVMALVAQAYRPGATMGSAFAALMREVLGGFGMLFLDPLAQGIREMAAPFLGGVIDRLPELVPLLRRHSAELEALGYHAQVRLDDDASLLFLLEGGKRLKLTFRQGRFAYGGHPIPQAELHARAGDLSPNALLRPVMQDYLLPTAAYVGGAAEIAYMAQSKVLYSHLDVRMPVIVPRGSFTLLDKGSASLLDSYGMSVPDLLTYREKVMETMAAGFVPSAVEASFATARQEMANTMAGLRETLVRFDPALEGASRKSEAKVIYQLEKLLPRMARDAMARDRQAYGDYTRLSNLVYPQGHLQERIYSLLPFLAAHGPDLPARLLKRIDLACPDHVVAVL